MRILSLALLLSAAALPAAAQQAPSAGQLHLRMLTWPGKVQPAAARQAPAPQARFTPAAYPPLAQAQPPIRPQFQVQPPAPVGIATQTARDPAWRTAYRPLPHRSSHMLGELTPAQAQAVAAQRAADAEEAEKAKALLFAEEQRQKQAEAQPKATAPSPPALPTSIYAPPPPAQAVAAGAQAAPRRAPWTNAPREPEPATAVAANFDQKAHYYSLHRAYGQQPDPIALNQQFLSTPSADLADPPPPPPPRILPNSQATAAQQTAARVQQRQSSDSAS